MYASAGSGAIGKGLASEQATELVSVALLAKVEGDLESLQERTGLSRTDIINRAISLYEFIETQLRANNDLLIRDRKTKKTKLFRFFLLSSLISRLLPAGICCFAAAAGRFPDN
jgi:hypothetical protein